MIKVSWWRSLIVWLVTVWVDNLSEVTQVECVASIFVCNVHNGFVYQRVAFWLYHRCQARVDEGLFEKQTGWSSKHQKSERVLTLDTTQSISDVAWRRLRIIGTSGGDNIGVTHHSCTFIGHLGFYSYISYGMVITPISKVCVIMQMFKQINIYQYGETICGFKARRLLNGWMDGFNELQKLLLRLWPPLNRSMILWFVTTWSVHIFTQLDTLCAKSLGRQRVPHDPRECN